MLMFQNLAESFFDELRPGHHGLPVQRVMRIAGGYGDRDLSDYSPRIHSFVDLVNGDARLLALIDHRPIDRIRSPMSREEGGVNIEAPETWRSYELALEHLAKESTDNEVRWILSQLGNEFWRIAVDRSEEHTSELQSHSFISYAVF